MVIVEPNFYDGFKFIENNLEELYNVINPTDYKRFKQKRYTRLYLPKFKVETTIELNGYLQQVGLHYYLFFITGIEKFDYFQLQLSYYNILAQIISLD